MSGPDSALGNLGDSTFFRMISQLDDFAASAQCGQEISRENLWPAEILLAGSATPLACSGGSFSDADHQLDAAGIFASYAVTFRVRLELLGTVPPVGRKLQWRRPGDTAWRQTLEIARVSDPSSDAVVILGCEAAVKPS